MRILTSGCSFSSNYAYPNWPAYLEQEHSVTNLAQIAAGNQYIANSVIAELSQREYDHVLVMWSGLTRLDFLTDVADQDWQTILNDYGFYGQLSDTSLAYVFSGGRRGSWQDSDSLIRKTFHTQYRVSSDESIGAASLLEMIKLQSYLKQRNISYHFMSYVNYWNNQKHCVNGNFGVYQYPTLAKLSEQLDFDRWIFSDSNKNGLFELCESMDDYIDSGDYPRYWKHPANRPGSHPGLKASEQWAGLISGRLGL